MQLQQVAGCAGFWVIGPIGTIGWVEEVWLSESDDPAGVVVELVDGRRAFLPSAGIEDVSEYDRHVEMHPHASLLALELPRLATSESDQTIMAATWRTNGRQLELPTAQGLPANVDAVQASERETGRPLWQVVAAVYACLVLIVMSLIGIDYLVAYLVTGSPPY